MLLNFKFIRDFFQSLKAEGSFARNITLTFSGNTIAVFIGFLFTPFITRVYSPEAYGIFALYVSVVQSISLVATFQLTRAFVLPQNETEFEDLFTCTWLTACFISLATALVLFLFHIPIFIYFNVSLPELFQWWPAIPIAVFLYAVNDILKSRNVRRKTFSRNAVNQIFSSTSARATTLVYGVITNGHAPGLILGDLLTKVLEVFLLAGKGLLLELKAIFTVRSRKLLQIISTYKDYPLYVLPGVWIFMFTYQLPVYVATLYFDTAQAGQYSLANSLLNLPLNLLAGSISPVFLQKIAETYKSDPVEVPRIVRQLSNRLFIVGLLPLAIIVVFGDLIFAALLGNQWVEAGIFAGYMGIYSIFQVVNLPLASLYRIYSIERLGLLINILSFVLGLVAVSLGVWKNNFELGIQLFSVTIAASTLLSTFILLKKSGLNGFKMIMMWLLLLFAVLGLLFGFRLLIEWLV
ncbi:MAG: lipopolysaccharide biosynthesis protein [Cyclobacteriaceae bacterium]|nr:lipopolysaccharide biosynthesis protein [Cyclobacteriaceae bacterium]